LLQSRWVLPSRTFEFKTKFLGQDFSVRRMGADDQDTGKAWELMRRQQATADAIGLGEMGDHYQVGLRTVVNKETQRLLNVVTRVPVTTGATLRRLLQVRAVRHVQRELGHYFNNNLVLFMSGMRNYDMAVALSDYTQEPELCRCPVPNRHPAMLSSLEQLELYAKGSDWACCQASPGEMLEAAMSGFKAQSHRHRGGQGHVIVGTLPKSRKWATPPTWKARPSSPRLWTTSAWLSSPSARSTWWWTCRPSCLKWWASTRSRP
jgi:hypothetical protein